MSHKLLSLLTAAYLLLCIVLGGSAQVIWPNLALEILGIALIAFAGMHRAEADAGSRSPMILVGLLAVGLLVILIQLIPLPPTVWASLPGRAELAKGFASLGYALPSQTISESPYASVLTFFAAIPAIGIFLAALRLKPDARSIALAVVAGTVLAILFGALQVSGGRNSWAYMYKISSPGAVGFFANQNHMATLLLVAIPMAVALLAPAKSGAKTSSGRYGIGAVLLILLIVGIGLNGSLAAYALSVPVILMSLTLLPGAAGWRRLLFPVALLAVAASVVLLATRPVGNNSAEESASSSVTSRSQIWGTTGRAIADSMPVGTGLGSFEQIYRHYEDPWQVRSEYVNHAHNDYLELILELGAPGAILILLFLVWWAIAAVRIWTSQLSTPFSRAATIVTGTILAHSIVDFPLRTAAISAIFAVSIAIMAQHLVRAPVARKGELRPSKHVTLG